MAALHRSVALRSGGDGYDWFFLAMAYWQLGEKGQARRWYAKAVQGLETLRPEQEELPAFQSEADAVLGIKPKNQKKDAARFAERSGSR